MNYNQIKQTNYNPKSYKLMKKVITWLELIQVHIINIIKDNLKYLIYQIKKVNLNLMKIKLKRFIHIF